MRIDGAKPLSVILGLDPRIHDPRATMDPRVKPEDDVEFAGRNGIGFRPLAASRIFDHPRAAGNQLDPVIAQTIEADTLRPWPINQREEETAIAECLQRHAASRWADALRQ